MFRRSRLADHRRRPPGREVRHDPGRAAALTREINGSSRGAVGRRPDRRRSRADTTSSALLLTPTRARSRGQPSVGRAGRQPALTGGVGDRHPRRQVLDQHLLVPSRGGRRLHLGLRRVGHDATCLRQIGQQTMTSRAGERHSHQQRRALTRSEGGHRQPSRRRR